MSAVKFCNIIACRSPEESVAFNWEIRVQRDVAQPKALEKRAFVQSS